MADLTTIDRVKEYLGIDAVESSDDALLERLVTAASAFLEQQTGRKFAAGDYIENHRAKRCITPKQWPLISIASVKVNGEALASSDYAIIDDSIYLGSSVFAGAGVWIGGNIIDYSASAGSVEVAYRAGYAEIPFDLEQAAIELAAYRYKAKDRISIANRSMPAGEVLSFVGYAASTASVDPVIENYRRVGAR